MCKTPEDFSTFTQGTMAAEATLRGLERGNELTPEELDRIAKLARRALDIAPDDLNPECRENLEAAVALVPAEDLQQPA